jgi:hypothetical protein
MPETRYIIKHLPTGKYVKTYDDGALLVEYSNATRFRLPASAYAALSGRMELEDVEVNSIRVYN